MKAGLPGIVSAALLLVLATLSSAHAQEPQCDEVFHHPDTGHPTTLSVRIASPLPGAEMRSFEPGCPTEIAIEGIASAVGIPPRFDFYLVIDVSGSTDNWSGVDLDGDGRWDTILEAEVAAARQFVRALDLAHSRVAVISFAERADIVQPLTSVAWELELALGSLTSGGNTNYGAALQEALAEHAANHDPTRDQVILFLSDGAPTVGSGLPPGPVDCIGFGGPACPGVAWAQEAGARGIVVDTFAIGIGASPIVLAEMARRGNGEFFAIDVAGEVIDILPAVIHVGVRDVLLVNETTGHDAVVLPGPDGRFAGTLPIAHGLNEIRVVARATEIHEWETECFTNASSTCIAWGCPASVDAECTGHARVAGLTAWTSDPGVIVEHDSVHADAPGADASGAYPLGTTGVSWTFDDDVAGNRRCEASVTIRDTVAPSFTGVPAGGTFECQEPPPEPPVAHDACDPDPVIAFDEVLVPGDCPNRYQVRRRWTATDASGHSASVEQQVTVTDDQGPVLVGVPADQVVDCGSIPVPAEVQAIDSCSESTLSFAERLLPGACPGNHEIEREWSAADACGNVTRAVQRISVRDTTPPVVTADPGRVTCLWPPRHDVHVVGAEHFGLAFADDCSAPVTWTFSGCVSDQPDDGLGDGSTADDCVISPDGRSLLVRAERQGRGSGAHVGRTYTVFVTAADACGNETAPVAAGILAVPHDRSEHDRTCPR